MLQIKINRIDIVWQMPQDAIVYGVGVIHHRRLMRAEIIVRAQIVRNEMRKIPYTVGLCGSLEIGI